MTYLLFLLVCVQADSTRGGFLRRQLPVPGPLNPGPEQQHDAEPGGTRAGQANTTLVVTSAQAPLTAASLMSTVAAPTASCQGFSPAALAMDLRRQQGAWVKKKVYKKPARHLFLAGLEGSGHHLWSDDIFHKCTRGVCTLEGADRAALHGVSDALWRQDSTDLQQGGLFMAEKQLVTSGANGLWTFHEPDATWEAGMRAVRFNAVAALRQLPPGLSLVNGLFSTSGQFSYPNFGGGFKFVQHPDVRLLAEVSEEAGVDLRVVVLVRNAYDSLVSTSLNRQFGGWVEQAVILEHNARVLAAQLRRVDPAFIRCVNYDTLPSLRWDLDAFLGGYFDLETAMRAAFHPSTPNATEESRHTKNYDAVRFLQAGIDEIKKVAGCHS